MTFLQSIKTCLMDKYFTFSGRASRSEFWWFSLFYFLVMVFLEVFFPFDEQEVFGQHSSSDLTNLVIQLVVYFGFFPPSISVSIRRLHDIGRSAWWQLISLTIIGIIPLIYWAIKKGTPGPNRFGEDPLQGDDNALTAV